MHSRVMLTRMERVRGRLNAFFSTKRTRYILARSAVLIQTGSRNSPPNLSRIPARLGRAILLVVSWNGAGLGLPSGAAVAGGQTTPALSAAIFVFCASPKIDLDQQMEIFAEAPLIGTIFSLNCDPGRRHSADIRQIPRLVSIASDRRR